MQNRNICVAVETVARAPNGSHNVLVVGELYAKTSHMHIDGAGARNLFTFSVGPEGLNDLFATDCAAFAKHEKLEQLEFAEGEVCRNIIEQYTFAGEIERDAAFRAVKLDMLLLLCVCRRFAKREAHDVNVAATGALG